MDWSLASTHSWHWLCRSFAHSHFLIIWKPLQGIVPSLFFLCDVSFQTILTTVVVDKVGFHLEPRDQVLFFLQPNYMQLPLPRFLPCHWTLESPFSSQFLVYSGFFLAVGIPFFISSLVTLFNGGLAKIRRLAFYLCTNAKIGSLNIWSDVTISSREGIWMRKDESQGPRPEPPVGSTECPQ